MRLRPARAAHRIALRLLHRDIAPPAGAVMPTTTPTIRMRTITTAAPMPPLASAGRMTVGAVVVAGVTATGLIPAALVPSSALEPAASQTATVGGGARIANKN